MRLIKGTHGTYIDHAFSGSPIPSAFVAALEANESGGNPSKTRYEAAEVGRFARVLAGIDTRYQGIGAAELTGAIMSAPISSAVKKLIDFCTSWGPLQIMGWQAIKGKYSVGDLQVLEKHYSKGYSLLRDFQIAFPETTSEKDRGWLALFTCWNAGAPDRSTTDPEYAARGLARMKLYAEIG